MNLCAFAVQFKNRPSAYGGLKNAKSARKGNQG